jgi:hypothetical protein
VHYLEFGEMATWRNGEVKFEEPSDEVQRYRAMNPGKPSPNRRELMK